MITDEFREKCERIAIQCRYSLGKKAYEPLTAVELAQAMGITLYLPEQLPNLDVEDVAIIMKSQGWHAMVVGRDAPLIIYRSHLSLEEFEWTIMHELAHLLLRHPPENLGSLQDKYVRRQYNKQNESEANLLADHLKFPKKALNYTIQKRLTDEIILNSFGIAADLLQRQRIS